MTDPIWDRVRELCEGYDPSFNAGAAYDVVRDAWRMGFDVIKAPEGSDLYRKAMQVINDQMRPAHLEEYLEKACDEVFGDVPEKS